MKVRNGFVSNSSSTSFIIKTGEPFSCPIEVAHHMLVARGSDEDIKNLESLRFYLGTGHINRKTNLSFNSCNYNTYICYTNGLFKEIAVYTCNNTDWNMPSSIEEKSEESGYYMKIEKEFSKIENGVCGIYPSSELFKEITSKISVTHSCENCYHELWYRVIPQPSSPLLQLFCPNCDKTFCEKTSNVWKRC